MGCDCGKPKCDGHCGVSPAVLQINNPSECVLFHRVEVPASMGDSKTNPPKSGAYKNVLLYYEADQTSWLYSSDGVPQKLVNGVTNYEDAINLPQINGVTLLGNKSLGDLGITDAIDDAVAAEKAEREAADEAIQDELLSRAVVFNTVADMKAATNLVNGGYARTLGYHAKNDGGGATYKIRETANDDVVDEGSIIAMAGDSLIAELIINEEGISFSQFGAYTDGTHESLTTQRIQTCIDFCQDNNIQVIDNGKAVYLIDDTIEVNKRLSIDLNYSIIRATTAEPIIEVDENLTDDDHFTGNSHHGKFEHIILDCNNISLKGLYIRLAPRRIFENIRVTNVPAGTEPNVGCAFYLDSDGAGAQVKFVNCYADNKTPNNLATVFYNAKSDVVVDGLDYTGFSRGILHTGGNVYYNNCHGFITSPYATSYPNSYFAKINSSSRIVFNNPYPDTQRYGFYIEGSAPRLKINGMCNYHNIDIATQECIATYGQAQLLYFDGSNLDVFTSITNSVFTSPTFANDARSVALTNLAKQNYFIDKSSSTPISNDLFNDKLNSSVGGLVPIQTSRYYRNDRTDHGIAKSTLYKTGDNVTTDIRLIYNPSVQGKISRLVNDSTKFARGEVQNFCPKIGQKFYVPYGHETENGVVNDGHLIFEVLPLELSGGNIMLSRFALYACGEDFSANREICDSTKNQDYIIDINVSYVTV